MKDTLCYNVLGDIMGKYSLVVEDTLKKLKKIIDVVDLDDKKIKATGYNGTPSGVESCYERGTCYRIENNIPSGTCYETCRSIHAEQNAIIQAGQDRCKGSTMYIYGHNFICILCKRFIVQSGIVKVYLKKDDESEIVEVSVDDIKKELDNQR